MSKAEDTIDFGFTEIPRGEKQSRVRGVFDSVASKYDLMNDAMSMGIHRVWKDMMVTKINPQPGERLIDIAGGTGDIAKRFLAKADKVRARRGGARASAIVSDINYEMLAAGLTDKDGGRAHTINNRIERVCGNAECLPFETESADVVTISFGIRNVTDRPAALREFHRILKPGGRLFILEFSTPPDKFLRQIYDSYSFAVIPTLGGLLAGDKDSYQYLVESIRRFPRQDAFAAMISEAGFARAAWQDYSGGIASLHWGFKL
jgi:demethylmenaquinone methyltransferase/2-methoxy-6-polyprenyl-1,4-benzoquinol methylase